MAIRVKTGVVEQQKADASVFGYKQVFESPLSAVSDALNQTARAAGSVGDMFAKKQFAVNKSAANSADSQYGLQLTTAVAAVEDAYAQENDDAIAEAESALAAFDTSAANFTLDNYAPTKVSDPTFYQANGYTDRATELYQKAQLRLRALKPHHQLKNLLKTSRSEASVGLHQARQNNLGRVMPQGVFDNVLTGIIALGNHEGLGGLTSSDAVTAFKGDASGMVREHFLHNINNSQNVDEIEYLSLKAVEQYGDQLEFVNENDRRAIVDAAEKRVSALSANNFAELKRLNTASFKNAESTLVNFVKNDATDLVSLQNVAAETSNVLMTVDRSQLTTDQQAQYDSLSVFSRMFRSTSVVVKNPDGSEESLVTSPINQGVLTAIRDANLGEDLEFKLPDEFLSSLTKDHVTTLLTLGNDITETVHENLQQGNTSVLTMFTDKPEEIATLLSSLGYEDMPIVTESKATLAMYNPSDANSVQAYLTDMYDTNTPDALEALADTLYRSSVSTKDDVLRAHQIELVASGADPEQVAFVYANMSVAAERYEPEQHAVLSQIIADVDPDAITGSYSFTADVTNSEVLNQYNLAVQNNDTKRAEAMKTLYQGTLVSVIDRVSATLGDVPLNLSDTKHLNMLKHEFFERENDLMLPSIGLRRKSADGVDVYIPPAVLDQINLEHRKPYTALVEGMPWYANAVRNATESETYQKIGSFVSRILKGNYTMLPQHFTERWLDVLVDQVVDSGALQYDPTIVVKSKNFDPELQDLVEDYELDTALAPEDLREVLKTTISSGRGSKVPLFSFGRKARGQGIALMYYNRRIGDYSPVIGTDFNMLTVSVPEAVDRLKEEGLYPRMDRYFRGVDDKNEVPQLPYTSEYFGN